MCFSTTLKLYSPNTLGNKQWLRTDIKNKTKLFKQTIKLDKGTFLKGRKIPHYVPQWTAVTFMGRGSLKPL